MIMIISHRDPVTLYSRIAQLSAQGKCDILMNDYIQKFEAKAPSKREAVGIASSMMSKIATEINIPVLSAAQVSRTIDSRGPDATLTMSDLKETGDLEQDADAIILMNPDTNIDSLKHCNLIKNRYGPVGTFDLIFKKNLSRFVNCVSRHVSLDRESIREEY